MTIPTTNVRLHDSIQAEYGGTQPTSLSEYYRSGSPTGSPPSVTAAGTFGLIPTGGTISMGTFRGKGRFVFSPVISGNTSNYNIRAAAISAGWDQNDTLIATVTINSGVTVFASSTGGWALDTGEGPHPGGYFMQIINNGTIAGCGGAGGGGGAGFGSAAGVPGGVGGPALRAQVSVSVTNNGVIAGGGGGGGGGRGFAEDDGNKGMLYYGGGGGGGGRVNGAAGPGGAGANGNGGNGGAGTLTDPGGGGASVPFKSGAGGTGGALGASGNPGGANIAGAGGAGGGGAGNYVTGNSNVIWVATGTRLGGVG